MDSTGSTGLSPPPTIGSFKEFADAFKDRFGPGTIYCRFTTELNTKSEKRIRLMSGAIRAKPDWIPKMGNVVIRRRWVREAREQGLTEAEIDYVFDELAYYATLHVPESGIMLSAVERVWISDNLIDDATTQELKRYAAILEDVPEKDKDWHPNSNEQVLNLVHPSLYPLIYKSSSILSKPIASPADAHTCYLSEKFCWLPTEFQVNDDGTVDIASYINNLHPIQHAEFYPTIATIFSKFVPMLEHVLTDLIYPSVRRVIPDPYNWFYAEEDEPRDYDASDFDERYEEWENSRGFVDPQPNPFVAPKRQLKPISLRGRRLQAIFKMSNIQLTPERPEYEGGSWHVEAMANERIVATGIYYYDVENITESNLGFREMVEEYFDYEQGDFDGVNRAYGIYENGRDDSVPLIQEIGKVEAKNGRCIVFPNIYQHKVSGFKLTDPTKPGHRKILAFFFIDPTIRIPSTEIVPPQQKDWWMDSVLNSTQLSKLPQLIQTAISDKVEFPLSLDQAKRIRLGLMKERSINSSFVDEGFAPEFSLCEH
ncbi:hypothetical protein COEREDRAFT_47022 [Coemansia reversa NRRL 1564]|uniref:DUF4246 domain-containing protein n=1 Tax=Coemansia reversa (strain ATCC 12441 / NRRL 1564) TaxID=763665 RepID=A0A2G5B6X9_COERN|nr:hypothetical protein COEREDRAFT_47022 [Coemansia reversa NRRL 1564]|eukprot:PIA14487.1 hypothetical protein COEREDRAFT_47022 [Coemansia reversa NRRL 1564]